MFDSANVMPPSRGALLLDAPFRSFRAHDGGSLSSVSLRCADIGVGIGARPGLWIGPFYSSTDGFSNGHAVYSTPCRRYYAVFPGR